MLSAPEEGLVAKMDLVDISAGEAIPVDYKRGHVPDVEGGAWEPERVQLCAQGLILRENGYACEGGILYFIGSRKRVSIPFDDALIARTRELLAEMREMGISGVMPAPLDEQPEVPALLAGRHLPARRNDVAQGSGGGTTRTRESASCCLRGRMRCRCMSRSKGHGWASRATS